MFNLIKKGFDSKNIVSFGNMFLIGNGHLGYRGTLEEYSKEQLVGLNVVGLYDQYEDKWRESINLPNPFYLKVHNYSILENEYINHEICLNIKNATFKRKTEYNDLIIYSKRFISQGEDNLLCLKYEIKARKSLNLTIDLGNDSNIYEINGPHFKEKKFELNDNTVSFYGLTNENKSIYQKSYYILPNGTVINSFKDGLMNIQLDVEQNKIYTFYCFCKINEKNCFESKKYTKKDFNNLYKEHKQIFNSKFDNSDVVISGNKKAQFAIRYSIYHLLILGNENYQTSIPARGVSGQTYKGAIFWDTEIFLLPFFTLTNPKIAKQLLMYRINTLNGALNKSKEEGYEGAFYAWESQEFGQEGCSKYNVSDPITNEPVRTYFGEKQIHISADIAYGVFQYINATDDLSILYDGGFNMILEIIKFFMSYSTNVEGKYHLKDVIGPDEYHERIDNNAFTNYMVKYISDQFIKYSSLFNVEYEMLEKIKEYSSNIYLPSINEDNLIEQFDGYYQKEDVYVDEVKKRIRHPQEYWGTENGVAYNTRVIKQADVITLLALLSSNFSKKVMKANFDFYYPYTEHGSSLSASMYSIVASMIGYSDLAYSNFIKSATIDLGVEQKMWAGGIYIGGTHPASNGGSYLSLIFGMAGLNFDDGKINLNPNLPKNIKEISFNICYKKQKYFIRVNKMNCEVKPIYD